MKDKQFTTTFILTLIGSILIVINALCIAINGAPLIFSFFQASSVEEVMEAKIFWCRIVFGVPGLVEGYWTAFWLIFTLAMFLYTGLLYKKPRKHKNYAIPITICSLLSLPIGGGFYIGAILSFIGGIAGMEWPKPFKETFFGKMLSATFLRSEFFSVVGENPKAIRTASFVVILASILSGIGTGLYTYNVDLIKMGGDKAFGILLQGHVILHNTVIMTSISFIGIAVVKWLLLSIAIYGIGAKITGVPSSYDKITRMIAFAYVPESLLMFLPVMFSNEPALSFHWPIGLYIVSRIWIFAALVIAITQAFDYPKRKALGVAILGGTIYWVIYHMFVIPTLEIPGVRIAISMPDSSLLVLVLVSVASIIAMLLGVFSKK